MINSKEKINKEKINKVKIASSAFLKEFNINSKKIGLAVGNINGRVPDKGKMVNKKSEEMIYLISGSATFYIGNNIIKAKKDDSIVIKPRQKFYYKAKNLKIVIITSPPWKPEQWSNVN